MKDVEVDLCRPCEGVWFDRDELPRALKDGAQAVRSTGLAPVWEGVERKGEKAGEEALPCPRCAGPLQRYRYAVTSPILVDGCKKDCGVWVDDGEIQKIYGYWLQMQEPASPQEKALSAAKLKVLQEESRGRHELLIQNLTRLDDQPGLLGAGGKVLQFIYTLFFKMGLHPDVP